MPIIAMNVIGWLVINNDGTIPQNTNGKHIRIRKTFFQLLNNSRRMARIMKIVSGTYFIRFAMASLCSSPSPTHLMLYPAGSSMASTSFFIDSTTFAGVASSISELGSHSASITLCPFRRMTTSSSHSIVIPFATRLSGVERKILS